MSFLAAAESWKYSYQAYGHYVPSLNCILIHHLQPLWKVFLESGTVNVKMAVFELSKFQFRKFLKTFIEFDCNKFMNDRLLIL